MSPIWQVAIVVQWAVVIALVGVVLALVRQLGVLTVRLNPAAAFELDEGPAPGTRFPRRALETLAGAEVVVGGAGEPPAVLFFVKPGCGPCDTMAPSLRTVAKDYASAQVRLILAVIGDRATSRAYAELHSLDGLDVVAATHLAREFGISSTPYALAVGSNGVVAKRGIVNALEHLEEVLAIARRGVSWPAAEPSSDQAPNGGPGVAGDALKEKAELVVTSGGLEAKEEV